METEIGNLFADIFAERARVDVMFVGSGSIRDTQLGPHVTLGDLRSIFAFDDTLSKYVITGEQLKGVFAHIMRPDNRDGEGECYQVNAGVRAAYVDSSRSLESLSIGGEPVRDGGEYSICLQGYHFINSGENLGLANADLIALQPARVVTTSARDVLEEYLNANQHLNRKVEGRLVYK